jgi:hypothetical protein
MCRYTLHICPYPDHDPIAALIFNPTKAGTWESCDKPKPWGRLSCGNLSIEHPTNITAPAVCLSPRRILAPRSNTTAACGNDKHIAFFNHEKPTPSEIPAITTNEEEVKLLAAPCVLCTTVLKLVSTKSKEIQNTARQSLTELESVMNNSLELRKMQKAVTDKIMELEALRYEAWKLTHALLLTEDDKFNMKA